MRAARFALAVGLTLVTAAFLSLLGLMLAMRCVYSSSPATFDQWVAGSNTVVEVRAIRTGEIRHLECGGRSQDALITVGVVRWQSPWRATHDPAQPGDRYEVRGTPEEWRDMKFGLASGGPVISGMSRHLGEDWHDWGLVRAPRAWFFAGWPHLSLALAGFRSSLEKPLPPDELLVRWNAEEDRAWREAEGDEDRYRPGPIQRDWLAYWDPGALRFVARR